MRLLMSPNDCFICSMNGSHIAHIRDDITDSVNFVANTVDACELHHAVYAQLPCYTRHSLTVYPTRAHDHAGVSSQAVYSSCNSLYK